MNVLYNKVFFTSDLHLNHKNIIKYCNRPFSSVEEMNEAIINNWNKVVPEDGITFVLGDCVFGGRERWKEFFTRLNGSKVLIRGNHDGNFSDRSIFINEFDQKLIKVSGDPEIPEQFIFMCHYPMLTWPQRERGAINLFGHTHSINNQFRGSEKLSPGQYDVGVDNNNFTPVSFQQLKEIITKQFLYANSERTLSENN